MTGRGRTGPRKNVGEVGKHYRLTRSSEFDRVYKRGKAYRGKNLTVYLFVNTEPAESDTRKRMGLSVGKQVGTAVERSRAKRIIREGFNASMERFPDGCDVAIVARRSVRDMKTPEITAELHEIGDRIQRNRGKKKLSE